MGKNIRGLPGRLPRVTKLESDLSLQITAISRPGFTENLRIQRDGWTGTGDGGALQKEGLFPKSATHFVTSELP